MAASHTLVGGQWSPNLSSALWRQYPHPVTSSAPQWAICYTTFRFPVQCGFSVIYPTSKLPKLRVMEHYLLALHVLIFLQADVFLRCCARNVCRDNILLHRFHDFHALAKHRQVYTRHGEKLTGKNLSIYNYWKRMRCILPILNGTGSWARYYLYTLGTVHGKYDTTRIQYCSRRDK